MRARTNAQKSLPPVTAVHDVEPPAPLGIGLADRLRIIEETGPATRARLDEIILYGGPTPDTKNGAKVIGAAIIDVEGYDGPKEMRAINGADTDGLGAGAPVYHASTPTDRQLSATQGRRTEKGGREASILGPRKESIFPHLNDAEMKIFEDIISRLPPGAKGTIYFTTVKIPKGETVPVPVPACAGCIRASFESAGMLVTVDFVSHAPTFAPLSGDPFSQSHTGGGEHDEPSVKPPPAGGPAPGEHDQPTGAAAKPGSVTDIEPPGAVPHGGAKRVSKATASVPHEMGIQVATGIASLGLGWLAARLKARVDEKQAKKQIDAFLEVARKKINANPDAALKKMMIAPETTVYAWIPLDSSVITSVGVDITSPEPVMSDSSPLFDLGTIDYQFGPIPQELFDSPPRISGFGGSHITMTHTITIDVPLQTPPIEEIIDYAKARNLPLDDLFVYASGRYQAALSSLETGLEARQRMLAAQQSMSDTFEKLQAQFKIAQQLHNVELQKRIADSMTRVATSMQSGPDRLKPIDEHLQQSDKRVQFGSTFWSSSGRRVADRVGD